jgi:hypothetical protein
MKLWHQMMAVIASRRAAADAMRQARNALKPFSASHAGQKRIARRRAAPEMPNEGTGGLHLSEPSSDSTCFTHSEDEFVHDTGMDIEASDVSITRGLQRSSLPDNLALLQMVPAFPSLRIKKGANENAQEVLALTDAGTFGTIGKISYQVKDDLPPHSVHVQCKHHGSKCKKWIMTKDLPCHEVLLFWLTIAVDSPDPKTHMSMFKNCLDKYAPVESARRTLAF